MELDLLVGALSPQKSEQTCRGFPMSVMNVIYTTTFQGYLWFWLNKLWFLTDLNEFPVSVMNAHYKDIFWVSLSYQLDKLCLLGDLNNEYGEVRLLQCYQKWPFQDHLATKSIISTQSSVSQENTSKFCLPWTWTMNAQTWVFPKSDIPLC